MTKHLEKECSTGITCRKFYTRLTYCYYFKERETYIKGVRLLFESILKECSKSKRLVIEEFALQFSSRAYVGRNSIISINKEEFKTFCLNCAINLDRLFSKLPTDNFLDPYQFKWKIKGKIHGQIKRNKTYNLSLSFEDRKLTEKDVDFYCLNNYLYNKAKDTNHDLLVMCVPQDVFYLIPYEDKDYTIQRGFLTFSKGNRIRKRGEHCALCAHNCKPHFYNGLNRLTLTI
jgi:hypothetical protein